MSVFFSQAGVRVRPEPAPGPSHNHTVTPLRALRAGVLPAAAGDAVLPGQHHQRRGQPAAPVQSHLMTYLNLQVAFLLVCFKKNVIKRHSHERLVVLEHRLKSTDL